MNKQEKLTPEILAAITAAVCVVTEKKTSEFVFTSIKRHFSSRPGWAQHGNVEILGSRQGLFERRQ